MEQNVKEIPLLQEFDDILTFQEVKSVLKIGRNKCYKLLQDGVIGSIKIGSTYRIPKANIVKFLKSQE